METAPPSVGRSCAADLADDLCASAHERPQVAAATAAIEGRTEGGERHPDPSHRRDPDASHRLAAAASL